MDDVIDRIAPCPWGGHSGRQPFEHVRPAHPVKPALYSPEERRRRDASPWTIVQAVLAPLQFLAFAVSIVLIGRYLLTGHGYEVATVSILVKTVALYAIMVTGSIWEKEVFGHWLFARAFFWEDAFSMLVLGLQTAYLVALFAGWGTARQQMLIAVAAYATYVINAAQFLLKLRAARLEGRLGPLTSHGSMGGAA
ncbi:2-vinyl bacteriochlorophyllide hydratase [Phenylobacterium sp.]|uniref:2-vinyl bacteriochlorophyllide hydratase n=1 Tax=Phenylobacterium sp. TaxID=1871053 RepID=UPI0025F0D72B|nr:2-vinyl bacteriochlorophyllide hydratase [Phenylobacterium sp.]